MDPNCIVKGRMFLSVFNADSENSWVIALVVSETVHEQKWYGKMGEISGIDGPQESQDHFSVVALIECIGRYRHPGVRFLGKKVVRY